MLGGFVAGFLILVSWSAQAARPDAPIVLIAQFAAGFISIFVALYIARLFAPKYQGAVVTSLALMEFFSIAVAVYPALSNRDFPTVALFAGNIVGCGVGWFQLVHKERY